ncbi:FAD-dependent monooxygenase [Saccharopolyspora sp. HNM0983]|uniref:FAD-dependent monooxygenase n=1 Tax=Saccharopolyspora montiporae TaxID=2781240 RepID=A0A929G116_9PSEU|nr:FAD-dependent monooxygenase [Saccharopolyspora sp. HNM0983]MBE9376190.1 FAD-dependent monooxygenase [Saccharopolyspora sp. HNM0983]
MAHAPPQVAIIGGGIGGLTLALALQQHGIDAHIHERTPHLREVGAAVALSANGTRVLHRLGLADQLAAHSATPTELIYRHGHSGHRVHALTAGEDYRHRFGAPYYGIHRADLQRLLAEACAEHTVHLDRRLVDIAPDGHGHRLAFADGTETRADIVVGADGVRSTVRDFITGTDPAVYSGTSGFRGLVARDEAPGLPDPDAIQFWMGPGAHVLHYPIGDGSVINFLAVVDEPARWDDDTWVRRADPADLAAPFTDWHPGLRDLIAASDLHQRWALFGQQPLNRWHRDGLVLLGDAAHAMLPHHGQGANQTIEDAATLAACLTGDHDRDQALTRYTRLRRARTRAVQRSSWVASGLLHLPDGPAARDRDRDLTGIATTLDWIHGHDTATAL